MVPDGRSKGARRVGSALGRCLIICAIALLAGAASAQGVGKPVEPYSEQQRAEREQRERHTGMALACAPSANGQDYTCYREPGSEKPTFAGRVWRWLFRLGRDPIAVFTSLLLGVGLVQVWIADQTAKRQLRAYLSFDFSGISDGSNLKPPGPHLVGIVLVKNTGQTPAYGVSSWAAISVVRRAEEHTLRIPDTIERQETTLGQGGSTSLSRNFGRALTPHEIAEVQVGTSAVYLYGRTVYRDVFKKAHTTNFRLSYSGVWPPPDNPVLNYCDDGNDAD